MPVHLTRKLGPLQLFTFGFGTIVGIAWGVLMGQFLASAGMADGPMAAPPSRDPVQSIPYDSFL